MILPSAIITLACGHQFVKGGGGGEWISAVYENEGNVSTKGVPFCIFSLWFYLFLVSEER